MAQHASVPVPSIPIMVALWEGEGFHGTKRTLIESNMDLRPTYFNDNTHAIGIHAGPQFNTRERETVSFFDGFNFEGTELCLGPGVYPTLAGFRNFGEGIISSVRFNPPGTRPPGVYVNGNNVLPWLPNDLEPAHLINNIPLVVRLSDQDLDINDTWTSPDAWYPIDMRERCLTLVEDAWDLGAMFGKEWDATTKTVVVQKGPNYYSSGQERGFVARLYEDPVTQEELQQNQEPPHLDLGPDDEFDHSSALVGVAAGVFVGLSFAPFDFRDKARAMRAVLRGA